MLKMGTYKGQTRKQILENLLSTVLVISLGFSVAERESIVNEMKHICFTYRELINIGSIACIYLVIIQYFSTLLNNNESTTTLYTAKIQMYFF